ncbi:TetR family transcriptional regulator [Novosphingobium sp. KCTC 2891]|uniref:TetR/AcrR family transcriptional regulator n=1 Tax=Novosphingobium sp. KCTC 2891 TaxID=2989730 RepID=UPI0022212C79|nr:TetR/AcrR family transcriptional regulator [Novosphingobium sp. KCTC 2891]MCW1383108.1 TetR family transcriptional regulator [Novosphingobium sp. KCTC 2891]
MRRAQTDIEAERERLVEIATALIEERGSTALTMQEVAIRAGMSPANVYRYFESKEALLEALAEYWFRPKVQAMEDVVASDLPARRKMYEFFARRFTMMRRHYEADPVAFQTYIEIGNEHFEQVRSYVDLADHYLGVIIGEAMGEGHFTDLGIDETISLVNQMVAPYCAINTMMMFMDRLTEDKLARIIDAVFDGLSAADRGAKGVTGLRAA